MPEKDILRLIETGIPLVMDEAYYEFAGEQWVKTGPQVQESDSAQDFQQWAGLQGCGWVMEVFPPRIAES